MSQSLGQVVLKLHSLKRTFLYFYDSVDMVYVGWQPQGGGCLYLSKSIFEKYSLQNYSIK